MLHVCEWMCVRVLQNMPPTFNTVTPGRSRLIQYEIVNVINEANIHSAQELQILHGIITLVYQ